MAVLTANQGSLYRFFDYEQDGLPPEGTFTAKIIDIEDRFDVERRKYQSEEMEKVDLTSFLFGFRDDDDAQWKIDTRPMKISGNPKSALYAFLKSILGKAPEMGWDYCELKGRSVLITVEHQTSNSGTEYASIAAISPLPKGYDDKPAKADKAKPQPKPAPAADIEDEEDDDDLPF